MLTRSPGDWSVRTVRRAFCEDCDAPFQSEDGFVPTVIVEAPLEAGRGTRVIATVHEQHPDTEGNGALLAAAPDLLAALRLVIADSGHFQYCKVLGYAWTGGVPKPDGPWCGVACSPSCVTIRAALLKAEA